MITLILYAAVIGLAFSAISGIGVGIGTGFGGMVGGLVAAFLIWGGISMVWLSIEGKEMPMAAYAGALIILFLQPLDDLNDEAKTNLAAEQWGLVIAMTFYFFDVNTVRWF